MTEAFAYDPGPRAERVEIVDSSGNPVDLSGGGGGGGDASAANQATMITALGTLHSDNVTIETDLTVLGTIHTDLTGIKTDTDKLIAPSVNAGTTDATTQRVVLASDSPSVTVLGTTTDTAVVSDANGTASGKLRGLVKLLASLIGVAGTPATATLSVQGIASGTAMKVDGSAVTQPVSAASLPLPTGAASATKQPALGTAGTASADVLSIQGVASMTALKVDGSGVTQPVSGTVTANAGSGTMAVSAAALPLPAGASTAAKQPGLGTAGTASADVLSVQGVASMTALKVDGSAVTQPVSGTVSASTYSSPSNGYVAVGTSDVQMPSLACSYLQVKALKSNTGTVYVGTSSGVASTITGSTNTTTGLELAAGDTTGWMPVSNANLFFLIASAASQGVTYAVMH